MTHSRALIATVLLLLSFAPLRAQDPSPETHRFDVASVRPSPPGGGRPSLQTGPANLAFSRVTLTDCLRAAYGLDALQITGPGWMTTDLFDIQARAAGPVNDAERNLMLQNLLIAQFKLILHRETKPAKVLVLRVLPSGPKLALSPAGGTPKIVPSESEGKLELDAFSTSIAELAKMLSGPLQSPVQDRTGLDQRYDFHLDLMPFMTAGDPHDVAIMDRAGIINAALQKELGLQLKDENIPMEFLVVDHAEHPVIN